MVIDGLTKGGKERRMLELVKGLKAEGVEVRLLLFSDSIEYTYVYDLHIRVDIFKRKFKKDLSVVFKLRRYINDYKPDIVQSWSSMSSIFLSLIRVTKKFVFINNAIVNAYENMGLLHREYLKIRFSAIFSDHMVANSQAGIKAYRLSSKKASCIYNGIDFGRFENLISPQKVEVEILGKPKGDRFIAAMVGAFEARKDYPTLIQAAILACNNWQDIVFLLIGDGSELEASRNKVPAQFLNTQIFFLGNRDNVESILPIIDVGLLISPSEGLSNSIIEYMLSAKPVIATKGGGNKELVKVGWNGFLVDQKSPHQIVSAISRLKNNPAEAQQMGLNGYNWAVASFDNKKVTAKYIELYQKLVNRKEK
jgi:glycosyltransferase involved in cell wall biosynthesis